VQDIPSGTVTLLFTDIEGSTRLIYELGEQYADVLADHRRLLREAFARHRGVEVDSQGDAFFAAFPRAEDAVAAAGEAQQALAAGPVRVRMGIHTGEPAVTVAGYVGIDVHRAARIMSSGHGGQVLLSETTRRLLKPSVEVLDLGYHRLKGLGAPQRLYQLGSETFPPPRTLYRTNLPVQPTPLIGRKRELEKAADLLRSNRLLTLTGPGGRGKTRLALQLAADLVEEFADGVFFVDLAPVADPELLPSAIAQALDLHEHGGQPLAGTLADYLRDRELLLLLDNFERLLDGAYHVGNLLAVAPGLTALATSRERLRLRGEYELPVPPLSESDALELFCARARALRPDFEPDEAVELICERLEGLPLALELAAARIKVLSPRALVDRLTPALPLLTGGPRDAPARQRTLSATIAWSYDLLTDEEKRLFASLSVFAGGCTFEAAEAVCEADLDTLQSLVDKSLVREEGGRFLMLDTIAEFARQRLSERGEREAISRRHAEHVLVLAERAEPELATGDSAKWLERLSNETANIRDALSFSLSTGNADLYVRLAVSLREFLLARGHLEEGRKWLEEALNLCPDDAPELRLKALAGTIFLARRQGDHVRAKALVGERLTLARKVDDGHAVASCFHMLGLLAADEGDHENARASYEEAVQLGRRLGHRFVGMWLTDLGSVERWEGNLERASLLLEESLALHRVAGRKDAVAYALDELGVVALYQGRLGQARELLAESLRLWQEVGANDLIVMCALEDHAAAIAAHGQSERAARLLGAAQALQEQMGIRPVFQEKAESPRNLAVATARADLGQEEFAVAFARGRRLDVEQAVELALTGAGRDVAASVGRA
jgi:predicted ATPase/class 3 adenylate cyclase/Tfp pilus assembly protein PilF